MSTKETRALKRRCERLAKAIAGAERHVRTKHLGDGPWGLHQTLRVTPAMAAGIASTVWGIEDLLAATLDDAGVQS